MDFRIAEIADGFADVVVVTPDPTPLLAVLKVPANVEVTEEAVKHIRKAWEKLWVGGAPFPIFVLPSSCDLSVIVDPRVSHGLDAKTGPEVCEAGGEVRRDPPS